MLNGQVSVDGDAADGNWDGCEITLLWEVKMNQKITPHNSKLEE
jgi:hypothetical protein